MMSIQISQTPRLLPGTLTCIPRPRVLRHLCRCKSMRERVCGLGGVLSSSLLLTSSVQAEQVNGESIVDQAVPVLFAIAVGALTLITIGVAYLSISSWWESRSTQSKKQQKSQEYDEKMKKFMKNAIGDKDKKPNKPTSASTSSKGFGDP